MPSWGVLAESGEETIFYIFKDMIDKGIPPTPKTFRILGKHKKGIECLKKAGALFVLLLIFYFNFVSTFHGVHRSLPSCVVEDSMVITVNPFQGGRKFNMLVERSPDWIIGHIQQYGNWEPNKSMAILLDLANVAKAANRRPIFMDIGANIGYFSALAAAHNAHVYAFEPMKKNYDMIRCTMGNSKEMHGIRLYTAGAAGQNTSCGIYSDNQNPNDGHVVCDTAAVIKAHPTFMQIYHLRETIDTLRLDSLGILAPDVVKIDTEGHEPAAFEGIVSMMDANPDRFKVILTEFGPWMIHRKGYDPAKYLEIFESRGYEIYDGPNKFQWSHAFIKQQIANESIFDLSLYKKNFQRDVTTMKDATDILFRQSVDAPGWSVTGRRSSGEARKL